MGSHPSVGRLRAYPLAVLDGVIQGPDGSGPYDHPLSHSPVLRQRSNEGFIHVLKYLARYVHRVAISNHRLVALEDGQVTFRYKDYKRGHRLHTRTLEAVEFLRRLMLHVLPQGLHKVRYFGFLWPIGADPQSWLNIAPYWGRAPTPL